MSKLTAAIGLMERAKVLQGIESLTFRHFELSSGGWGVTVDGLTGIASAKKSEMVDLCKELNDGLQVVKNDVLRGREKQLFNDLKDGLKDG